MLEQAVDPCFTSFARIVKALSELWHVRNDQVTVLGMPSPQLYQSGSWFWPMYSRLIRTFGSGHGAKVIVLRGCDLRALHLRYKGFHVTALGMIRTSPAVARSDSLCPSPLLPPQVIMIYSALLSLTATLVAKASLPELKNYHSKSHLDPKSPGFETSNLKIWKVISSTAFSKDSISSDTSNRDGLFH